MNKETQNIFDREFDTPCCSAPFSLISEADYEPAIERGMALGRRAIEEICSNPAAPDFENTIVALERAGAELDRVLNIFYPMQSAMASEAMMDLDLRISPKLSEYSTEISMNPKLWERVKAVYDSRDSLTLDTEDSMLLRETYESFTRSGALLEGDDREEFRRINAELSELTSRFGQNVLRELNSLSMTVDADGIDGLPEHVVEEAARLAADCGEEGRWRFTLAQPTYMAFMKYSTRRDLRERMWRMYNTRNTSGEFSNIDVVRRIVSLRHRRAQLLGFDTFADFKLSRTMAGTTARVMELLERLADSYRPAQLREFAELKEYAGLEDFSPWDYSFYANRLRKEKLGFDEEALRPYFRLENVVEGVFGLANSLYGIRLEEAKDIDVYHPDVKAYTVIDADGTQVGLLYTDFFPRESKRPGAWMTDFRPQWRDAAGDHRPHVSIVMNFTKPSATRPSLLTPGEVRTLLHEFGHALHGLLSKAKYASLSGTNVYRDFVELPSQFNENFLTRREFLDSFARHYLTGDPIPEEEIDRMVADTRFGVAYACLRQLNFGLLDMAWHTVTSDVDDAERFEVEAGAKVAMFDHQPGSMVSTQFSHIFAGGYAAGYYSYKWAELLDADAFEMFVENGVTDPDTAARFRREILEKGGTEDPAVLYRRFRGADPDPDALLRRDGLK